mmetsp:Transcript_138202/g.440892  ORF Transcript_138202/g.440892 Transcript_138202/m.440892 type:complete len:120 (+) Transcript_138202:925-1284(+)
MDHWRGPWVVGNESFDSEVEGSYEWQDICDSIARRATVREALARQGGSITPEDLWMLLSTPPCRAHDTVYTTAMCAATGVICTRQQVTEEQAAAGRRRWGGLVAEALQGRGGGSGARRQ